MSDTKIEFTDMTTAAKEVSLDPVSGVISILEKTLLRAKAGEIRTLMVVGVTSSNSCLLACGGEMSYIEQLGMLEYGKELLQQHGEEEE